MSRLPILTGLELIKILEKVGFKIIRQKGSHVFLKNQDNRQARRLSYGCWQ
ncbi:type II toxin-antitoxin system HicA family toxin [bacterium]|nr:type II toxin-antitoxin system HicA family toxin [bacterium]MBU4483616.1 type II toxin-antitoxin system HicA family toxin [Actinomycetota bacterium]